MVPPPVTAVTLGGTVPETAELDVVDDTEALVEEDLLVVSDDLLVEDVSIDGMCGVY
jgi:mycofactocin precursor